VSEPYAPEEAPGTIHRGQRIRIITVLADLGVKSHDDRVSVLSDITRRKVDSTNDLSYREAANVILALGRTARR
jgi:hypothetical protein